MELQTLKKKKNFGCLDTCSQIPLSEWKESLHIFWHSQNYVQWMHQNAYKYLPSLDLALCCSLPCPGFSPDSADCTPLFSCVWAVGACLGLGWPAQEGRATTLMAWGTGWATCSLWVGHAWDQPFFRSVFTSKSIFSVWFLLSHFWHWLKHFDYFILGYHKCNHQKGMSPFLFLPASQNLLLVVVTWKDTTSISHGCFIIQEEICRLPECESFSLNTILEEVHYCSTRNIFFLLYLR